MPRERRMTLKRRQLGDSHTQVARRRTLRPHGGSGAREEPRSLSTESRNARREGPAPLGRHAQDGSRCAAPPPAALRPPQGASWRAGRGNGRLRAGQRDRTETQQVIKGAPDPVKGVGEGPHGEDSGYLTSSQGGRCLGREQGTCTCSLWANHLQRQLHLGAGSRPKGARRARAERRKRAWRARGGEGSERRRRS